MRMIEYEEAEWEVANTRAGVGLVSRALQVLVYFMGTTGHITLGVPSDCGTSVILPVSVDGCFDTTADHGHMTTRVLFFQLLFGYMLLNLHPTSKDDQRVLSHLLKEESFVRCHQFRDVKE